MKYKVNGVKPDFMASEERRNQLVAHIEQLMQVKQCQEELDKWYEAFVNIYHKEMDSFYKKLENTPKSAKNFHIMKKEWWTDDLTALAKETHRSEKNFITLIKQGKRSTEAKAQFLTLQKQFDKLVKSTKRKWQRNKIFNLDKINDSDPNAFWDYIKSLRKPKKGGNTKRSVLE